MKQQEAEVARPIVRLTVNLNPETAEALERLAKRLNVSENIALHRAILATDLLSLEIAKGKRVVVKGDRGSERLFQLTGDND
jgi:hypothetical protein